MMGWIVVIAAVFAFYFYLYQNWSYKAKFTFKTVMIYITALLLFLMIIAVISIVKDAVEERQTDTLEYRMDRAEAAAGDGKLLQLADTMVLYDSYEPEFEYAWERVLMYTYYNRYLIFRDADEAGMGEEYKALADKYKNALINICIEPVYAENIPYGQDFLKRAELLSE